MNARTAMRYPLSFQLRPALIFVSLLLLVTVGCRPANSQSAEQHTPSPTESQPTPTTPLPTETSEAMIPAGWSTYTSQRCEYEISYPSEMRVTDETPYSRTLAFSPTTEDEVARNFVYLSVIDPEIQSRIEGGVYDYEVYNYDPGEAEILLNMQVGESEAVRELANVTSGFTYQRQPDTPISGYAAQTYENTQPWEFPSGTKEIRYFLSLNGCNYLIGGYFDTTQSNQPGAITEDLFHQIMSTIQVTP